MPSSDIAAYFSLIASAICFILYVWQTILAGRSKSHQALKEIVSNAVPTANLTAPTVDELTKLLEAMSKLTENLTKAGPALVSLVGSTLFSAIAALSSGALR